MVFPQWTIGNVILYGYLGFLTLAIVPMELRGMAMMEYSKFRTSKGISSRIGMLLIYGLPLVALFMGALSYLLHPSQYQIIVFGALFIHFTKRILEVLFLHKYSGPMNPYTAILIAFFYSLTAFLPVYLNRQPLMQAMDALAYVGLALFVVSEGLNFLHHKILSNLRRDTMEYVVPRGGLFEWVACPHFLFEIMAWLGLFLLFRHLAMFLFFAFMAAYLTGRSLRTLKWYREKFADFPPERKAIFPFVL
jgi:very-long-chain enoyl-CoA reductase